VRDPLVGRDLLIGSAIGAALIALGTAVVAVGNRLGIAKQPTLITEFMLTAVTNLPSTAYMVSYSAAACVLSGLETMVMLVIVRIFSRRTWIAVSTAMVVVSLAIASHAAPETGWPLAILIALLQTTSILVLMRFGLLAGAASIFVSVMLSSTVASLDFAAWYADRALVPLLIVGALLLYGAATALAGKPIWGDPLKEPVARS
jgi:hypothetical protein